MDEFLSKDWINKYHLKSFFCYPLLIRGRSVGTLSLYTGYEHYLYDNDKEFLTTLSCLLAALSLGIDGIRVTLKKENFFLDKLAEFNLPEDIGTQEISRFINSVDDKIDKNYEDAVKAIKLKYQQKIEELEERNKRANKEIEN